MRETFESLLVKLSRADVDYLVAGGVAVCLNGFVRTTQHLDILVDASHEKLERLLAVRRTFGAGFARELSPADFALEEGAVRVNEDFTLDIFTLLRNRTFSDFQTTACSLDLGGIAIPYLAPESLIEVKSVSSREKDRWDVAALRQILAGETVASPVDLAELTPSPDDASSNEPS